MSWFYTIIALNNY